MSLQKLRKRTWLIIGGFALLLTFLVFGDFPRLYKLFAEIRWQFLGIATLFLLLGYLLITIRLRYLLFNQTGWWSTFYANCIAYMAHISMFMPAMPVKIVSVTAVTTASASQASSAILIERLLEQIMRLLAGLLVIGLFTSQQTQPTVPIGGTILFLVLVFGALYWVMHHQEQVIKILVSLVGNRGFVTPEQIRDNVTSVLEALNAFYSRKRLIVSLLISVAAWSCFLIFQILVLVALPTGLPVIQMLLIAATILAVMPPSINVMLIVYQIVVTIALVAPELADLTTALVYAITLHLIQMICWLILGRWSMHQTNLHFSQMVQAVKQYTQKDKAAPATDQESNTAQM